LRRTSVLLLSLAATLGGVSFISAPAGATPLPAAEPVATASDATPSVLRVQTPSLTRVTVSPGDTLWGIGIRTHRSWPALASYNRILDPNLIYVGQVITIPPATYRGPVVVSVPARTPRHTPPVVSVQPVPGYSTPVTLEEAPGVWGCIAAHESGGVAGTNTGNGYYGAFQDTPSAWAEGGGGPGLPSDYSYATQLAVNERIQAISGWGAWPVTSRMCGV
jgi:LysM repeat protein